jgi:hypothetical protein
MTNKDDGHVAYECKCGSQHCQFCDGGLFSCTICGSFEGATTTQCPGVKMTNEQRDAVYAGQLDFRNGQWVNKASRNSPHYDPFCTANGSQTCSFKPNGPRGESQCEWCGIPENEK